MMRLRASASVWQTRIVFLAILTMVLVPLLKTVSWVIWGWPDFPKHRALDASKYAERLSLLKYFISLGFSLIGATWYLANGGTGGARLSGKPRIRLSWAWTLLGIALLSAIVEIYLTYKDFYYWPLIVAEGYPSIFRQAKHCASLHLLHWTYKCTDYCFFLGAGTLVMALVGVLHGDDQKDP